MTLSLRTAGSSQGPHLEEAEEELARRREWLPWLAVGLAGLSAWAVAGLLPLAVEGGPVFCLFRRVSGVACPGCGLTRAFGALAGGRLQEAMAFHPLAPLLAVELVGAWLAWGVWIGARRRLVGLRLARWLALGTAGALLAVWGVRLWQGTLP